MKRPRTPARLMPLILVLSACITAQRADAQQEVVEPQRVLYKQTTNSDGEPVELYLHVFYPGGERGLAEDRPAIVFFFGGGWSSGSPAQFYPHCRELAGLGIVAASAEYRVRRRDGTLPQDCVEDGKSAVRFMRANADEMGIDPQMIAAGGGSAGGHVAACTGLVDGFEAEGEDHDISSVPNLLVLFNPVIDTTVYPPRNARQRMGGLDPLELSPMHHIHEGQPPTIYFNGDADTTTPIASARSFQEQSEAAGALCVLHEYEGAGHGFFNHSDFRPRRGGTPNYYAQTMRALLEFLTASDYIEPADG